MQTEERCRQLDAELRDKGASIEQQREEKEKLASKVDQLEQAKNEVGRNLENKKLELQQLKEDAEKLKDKNVNYEQHITKVFTIKGSLFVYMFTVDFLLLVYLIM